MYISNILNPSEPEDCLDEEIEETSEHRILEERLRKTLYYARPPGTDRPSMPLTELAVEYFRDNVPKRLGHVDMEYASSVGRKAYISPCSMMVGLMYANRVKKHANPEYLQQVSSSDLFLISMMIASKYLYDEGTDEEVFNDEWADAAGMDTEDINELEREFLRESGWNLYVNEKEFADVLRKVEMTIAFRKGRERGGSFTYTDLHALTDDMNLLMALNTLMVEIVKVVMVCCAAYLMGTMTLAASTPLLSVVSSYAVHLQSTQQTTLVPSPPQPPMEPDVDHSSQPTLAPCSSCPNINTSSGLPTLQHTEGENQELTGPNFISVMKQFLAAWVLPTPSVSLDTDSDWLCEYGSCGLRQEGSVVECVNVTSQSVSCRISPCCCCQPMPNLEDYSFTNFPHTTSLGFQTGAVR